LKFVIYIRDGHCDYSLLTHTHTQKKRYATEHFSELFPKEVNDTQTFILIFPTPSVE